MMQTLRNKMKHIMLITLLAFLATIIFSWGMGGFKNRLSKAQQGIIGVVNGTQINYEQFSASVNEQLEAMRAQTGNNDIPDYQVRQVRDQVWETLVSRILIQDEIRRQNITITDEEVVFTLRNRPPQFIMENEQFQTDGRFDFQKYREALENPNNYQSWIPVENYLRTMLPEQKIQQRIVSSVRVTDNELLQEYRRENETAKVRYAGFTTSDVSDENLLVSKSEIKNYYNENKDKFKVDEMRKIRYVLFEKNPSQEDTVQTYEDARDIITQLKRGADFAELAKDYSEDRGTAEKGGDLGFFGKNEMVGPFAEAAFSAKIRDIVGPVKSRFGLHIIQVLAKKREKGETKVHARHILLKFLASPETEENVYSSANYFYDEITENGNDAFDDVAAAGGQEVKETNAFPKGEFIPGLGLAGRINFLAFNNKKGWTSTPVTLNDNIIVFQVSDIIGEHYKPLEDVEKTAQNSILAQKKKDVCREQAQSFRETISKGTSFDEAAAANSIETAETGFFKWNDYIPKVGKNIDFTSAAFSLGKGEASDIIETSNGFFVLEVLDKQDADPKAFEEAKESLKNTYMQKKQRAFYIAWYNSLKAEADIEDFREVFF